MADQKEPIEIMLEKKVGELQRQNEIMRQLGTLDGFFTAVFNMVKHSRTNEEAFNAVNDQYFEIWGQYRFSDFESYRRSRYYHYKKK
ncbi:hypothetical protein [Flavobacterium sp. NRK1]|uniref:hypothetical protein n=1 Tax=Flavobacterium sp. NRK1 TaxID=2954929 RepID=UPI0020927B45|nr:hypothetical protein [Flavobacterium sp. NRK1]MCO6149075.1 hypothetical protein [Flavobacterium sp. NRK1]